MAIPQSACSLCITILYVLIYCCSASLQSTYLIGTGSYDITGPAADVNMMGYANMEQVASGIHFRLRARTFIVAEPNGKRVVFVNLDACMASQIVTIKVLERLESSFALDWHSQKRLESPQNCFKLFNFDQKRQVLVSEQERVQLPCLVNGSKLSLNRLLGFETYVKRLITVSKRPGIVETSP
eukprot:Gb_08999 [translate_table: standard]